MKKLLLVCLSFTSVALFAQTTHFITASGMSFTPNTLTIEAGDSVVFTNTSGTHNVNGTQTTFPSNPVSFGNSIGTGWTYGFKFTVAGDYSYKCDVHATMTGTIAVVNSSGTEENNAVTFSVYPNPATDFLHVILNNVHPNNQISVVLFDMSGKEVLRSADLQDQHIQLSLENLNSGIYFCSVFSNGENVSTEKIAVK
ncbi:MAG: T9SS type A sorting domain-containing protein [Crocinitomicaceae bacterium]|nr:T9SS type A sorting domain-containing protein [Crocinitomicaceae bacterium]